MYKIKIATLIALLATITTQSVAFAMDGPLPIIQTFFSYLPLTMGLP